MRRKSARSPATRLTASAAGSGVPAASASPKRIDGMRKREPLHQRFRAARFAEHHIDIFAAGNLWVRRDEMVAPLALAHNRARLVESLSEVSRVRCLIGLV